MSASSKSQYHHQDLYQAVLKEGRRFVETHGHADLSLRKIAEKVGVAPSALYHHFKNRRAILIAVAESGFDDLHAMVPEDEAYMAMPPKDRLQMLAKSFIAFARQNQQLFRLMYESEMTGVDAEKEILVAQNVGYELMLTSFGDVYKSESVEAIKTRVISFWSLIYGFCHLVDRQLLQPNMVEGLDQEAVLQHIVDVAIGEMPTFR